jgi:DNA-binding response OmpR family regulator
VASDMPVAIPFGKVRIDCKALRGKLDEEPIELTPRELKVLSVLFRERGHAVSREALLNEVWGVDYYETARTLDRLIVKLRQKIEEVPAEPRHLLTVHTELWSKSGGLSRGCGTAGDLVIAVP